MGLFGRRKDETLNEQLLHEAGLDQPEPDAEPAAEPAPDATRDPRQEAQDEEWQGVFARALARPGEYDQVLSVSAPGLAGERVEFATLPEGDVLVDDEQGDADLSPLADAVEEHLKPPYRVVARRAEDDLWTVAAREIDVLAFDFSGGDEIELVRNEGERELRVDGEDWPGEIPELERAGESLGVDVVVQADRLDGDLWEVRVSAL